MVILMNMATLMIIMTTTMIMITSIIIMTVIPILTRTEGVMRTATSTDRRRRMAGRSNCTGRSSTGTTAWRNGIAASSARAACLS